MDSFFEEQNLKRIEVLKGHLDDNYFLLKEYEEELDIATRPEEKLNCNRSIKKLKQKIVDFTNEIQELLSTNPPESLSVQEKEKIEARIESIEQLLHTLTKNQ